ncbi:sigma-54-dependent Fis family transcriptional regulator [Virgibacillus senegalensis]|uniref:sigma-54-dependent Fis family transcriptional regulator n=1 Tax=Virgibacillus senegalensis TaxID=1499679 RepID=UPI00069D40FB|nr:sigma-54-dependent Fis family transcriptional regulator [Virgibacillus senegalensis]
MIQDFVGDVSVDIKEQEWLKVERWMSKSPLYITSERSVKEAGERMLEHQVDCLPVVDEQGHPIGAMTLHEVFRLMTEGNAEQPLFPNHMIEQPVIHSNDSLLEIGSRPCGCFSVVNDKGELVGTLSRQEMEKAFRHHIESWNQKRHASEALSVILETAYEGIAVVDEHATILEFNEAYSRFTGIPREDAIGKHVQEVIDNTNLHNTVKTGMTERGVIQYINGEAMIVHRIPIWREDRVVGAIGMLIFEGVGEVYRIYEKLQRNVPEPKSEKTGIAAPRQDDKLMSLDQIIGKSASISIIKQLVRRVSKTDATILIAGESGTGKELFAQSIHQLSGRSTGPFVSVNCGAVPDQLFESELFGYEAGAFTGASREGKPGKFELAQNGTLFLDEIAEMPLLMQTKLLRVLQEKEAERVGGTKKYNINTRIIAATNRNLKDMVEAGQFRKDLYYRIQVIELTVPPLRERPEDIPLLLSHYMKEICQKYRLPLKTMTKDAMAALSHRRWEGNVRELINVLEKLLILVEGDSIDVKHLSLLGEDQVNVPTTSQGKGPDGLTENVKEQEKQLIEKVLKESGGNKTKAADKLGIHRTTLYQKIKKYQLDV